MSLKSEKLTKTIQDIQQIVATRIDQARLFQTVAQTLEDSIISLRQGKLTLRIVSRNVATIQALQNLLNAHQALANSYQIKAALLPDELYPGELASPAALTLELPANRTVQFELSHTNEWMIGRRPGCPILIPDHYYLVSGCHASIKSLANGAAHASGFGWQICDANSRNGTFVNGQKIEGCQGLEEGDRITLGLPYPTETSPELIFDYLTDWHGDNAGTISKLIDCDVFCLAIDPNQNLSTIEKQLITTINQSKITKRVLIAEIQEPSEQILQQLQINLVEVQALMKTQVGDPSFELFFLPSHSCLSQIQEGNVEPHVQQELERIYKFLETLVKRKPEDLLSKRLATQVFAQLKRIDRWLTVQEKLLDRENQHDQCQTMVQEQLKEQIYKAFKQIQDDKNSVFKQAKDTLKQVKADLLYEGLETSISYQLRRAVAKLKPYVTQQNGRKHIELKFSEIKPISSDSYQRQGVKSARPHRLIDANVMLMEFCRIELSNWAAEEWRRICQDDVHGGIAGFCYRAHEILNSIPHLELKHLSQSLFQLKDPTNQQAVFSEAFAKPPSGSDYQEPSPVIYVLKKVRSQRMQFIFLFSFFSILGIAGRRQIMRYLTAPIIAVFQRSPIISWLILIILLYFLIKFLTRLYQEDRDLEREKEAKKLRDRLWSHYQDLIKNRMADKLIQNLSVALEKEEQRIEGVLQTVKQQADNAGVELEAKQAPMKHRMEQRRRIQQELKSDREKLQRLQRSLM
jgi:hypothetical protein